MTKLEAIILCGDVLTELDVLCGSLYSEAPERKKLDEYRCIIDKMQLKLVDQVFHENTEKYKEASAKLEDINKKLSTTIEDLGKVADTIETVSKFVTVVDQLLIIAAQAAP